MSKPTDDEILSVLTVWAARRDAARKSMLAADDVHDATIGKLRALFAKAPEPKAGRISVRLETVTALLSGLGVEPGQVSQSTIDNAFLLAEILIARDRERPR